MTESASPGLPSTIFVISDSTGGTAEAMTRAALAQFEDYLVNISTYSHVNERRRIEALARLAARQNALIVFTLVNPEMREAMVERNYDYMSHGIYNTRYLYTYTEEQEREFYRDTIETLKLHTGKQLKGMLGPAISGTERTPDLMAEAGLIYHTDWMHDDQPVPIKVKSGKLISVPYSIELNDSSLLRDNHYEGDYFARICKAQFDQLYKEGAGSGRVMCIALHPFLIGQPHRIKYLDEIMRHIMSHDGVWQTTADEIADYYIENYYDDAVAHAAKLNS